MRKLFLVCVCAATSVLAQEPGQDVISRQLVPPELIMQHQAELGITADQREQIKAIVTQAQAGFTSLQWDMQAAVQSLGQALAEPPGDDGAVLELLDNVLDLEKQVKRAQLMMLLELRRVLTPAQLDQAKELKRRQPNPAVQNLRRQIEQLERRGSP